VQFRLLILLKCGSPIVSVLSACIAHLNAQVEISANLQDRKIWKSRTSKRRLRKPMIKTATRGCIYRNVGRGICNILFIRIVS